MCTRIKCIRFYACYGFGYCNLNQFFTIFKRILINLSNRYRNIKFSRCCTIQIFQYATILECITSYTCYRLGNCNYFNEVTIIKCSSRNYCLNCYRYILNCSRNVVIIRNIIIVFTGILPYCIFRLSSILTVNIFIIVTNITTATLRSISKDIAKYCIIISCIRTLSYKRKRYIFDCVTSLECSKSYLGYCVWYYYLCYHQKILECVFAYCCKVFGELQFRNRHTIGKSIRTYRVNLIAHCNLFNAIALIECIIGNSLEMDFVNYIIPLADEIVGFRSYQVIPLFSIRISRCKVMLVTA